MPIEMNELGNSIDSRDVRVEVNTEEGIDT